ncbi:MAG TPA: 3-hydroxyacyl-CoA dehydrogenase NAD-binding domain-containing protein [Longimicrobiales bacterium]
MAITRTVPTEQAALALDVDSDGVAWLVFDRPESRVNLLASGVMARLDLLLADVEEGIRAGRIRAVVVRSGKPGTFIAGADVEEIAGLTDAAEAEALAREGQRIFRRLDLLPAPTIAAIEGACLGGGTELALACDVRLASDAPETRIGLPEVRLGIIPGFGGTVRLPRLIGLRAALDLILTGRTVDARRAERIGLVDECVPAPLLIQRARHLALTLAERKGAAGGRRRRAGLAGRLLDETPLGRRLVLSQARKRVLRETRGHYPAPLAALDVLADVSPSTPLDEALAREARAVGPLIASAVCKNLIHVFRLTEAAKKAGPRAEARPVERVAVLGAGTMGGGIAQLLADRGLAVRLKDIRAEAISQGLRHARELFDKAVQRKRMERRHAEQALRRISPTLDYSGFGTVDVVIEAVVEKMDVKKQVLREVEERVPPHAVLTSNTSSLSITEMQHALARPENFCGMHFFNPVHRMPLVEVVRGAASSDEALATVVALARRLGKTPLVVNDGPGFLVNRILAPYLNEAGWLLGEGARIEDIDRAMLDFGMPMGPLRLLDEVGLDVARHAAAVMYEAFGERMRPAPALTAMAQTGRLGRKGGLGYYRYENDREKGPDPDVYTLLGDAVPAQRREIPAAVIQERAVLAMINEAARALEDGIVETAADVDLALIMGIGFPPFRGGLLRYADTLGIPTVLQRLEIHEREFGPRFHPAPWLRERAAAGKGFYA